MFLRILFLLFLYNVSYANVISWSINQRPSLSLADTKNVIISNQAYIATNTNDAFIRIQDVEINQDQDFTKVFVLFSKTKLSSYVEFQVFDTFTDELLFSQNFYEEGVSDLDVAGKKSVLVYLKIIMHGADIELRGAGLEYASREMLKSNSLRINKDRLNSKKDILEVSFTLEEEAKVHLNIYDNQQNITERIISDEVLAEGSHTFYWDPENIKQSQGDLFYIFLKAENLRSKPVELLQEFYLSP